ncbi:MAG: MerR family transcriptional regulator [Actinobacteria bacterium]|nr:MerR family transcriptional regulator [Actinomycetota bacterium]
MPEVPRQASVEFTQAVYVISVAAEIAGVHPQTLRIYERRGLLEPTRTSGGSRRFSDFDLAKLRRIQELTEAGCNIEGVKRILALEAEVVALRQAFEQVKADSRAEVALTKRSMRRDVVPFQPEGWIAIHRSRRDF